MQAAQPTDAQLVEAILEGDEASFTALHDRYRERVYRFAVKRLGDATEAEDVTQEVFLQVFRSLPSFEGRSSLLTWMLGIAHHYVCRRFRSRSATTLCVEEADLPAVAEETPIERWIDARRTLAEIDGALELASSREQRKVFHLRYAQNHTTRAIARRVGKSNQAVKISLFRTRRMLAQRSKRLPGVLSA